jgi:AcrR family transcriptional regulator
MAILDAATEIVFGTASPEDFTMQNVADAAGVSHRTLYRYFPTRRALINGVGAAYDEQLEELVPMNVLASFSGWVDSVDEIIGFGSAHRETLTRALALSVVSGEFRTDRDDAYWALFRDEFPNLDSETAMQDFAVLRHVLGAVNAILIGQRFDLETQQVVDGVTRAIGALVADIRSRDKAAGEGGKRV